MKQKWFIKLFLLTTVLLFLLSGCQLFGQETVWCLSERVTTKNGETTIFQIRYDKDKKPLEYLRGPENAPVQVGYCTYDKHGNLITYKNPHTGIINTYDSHGNILSHSSSDYILLYTYNAQDQMLSMEEQNAEGKQLYLVLYSYDTKGNLIKESSCWTGGIPSEKQYTYDSRGNVLTETYLVDGQIMTNNRWEYDRNGNILQEQRFQENELIDHLTYTYDSQGNMLSSSQYRTDGSYLQTLYVYNTNGSILSKIEQSMDADGTIHEIRKISYTYDEKRNLIKQQDLDADGNEKLSLWTYDENGNNLTQSLRQPGFHYTIERTYDQNNNLLTESFAGTNGKHNTTYSYDEQGRLVNTRQGRGTGVMYQESWEYDANGNLVRNEITHNTQTTVHTYTYTPITLSAKQAQALRESQAEIWKQLHEIYFSAE